MTDPNSSPDVPPADYHRTPSKSFWPDPDEYATAKAALGERGRYVSDYLRASLRFLNHSPDAALETLREHWPPPRRPGRPRRDAKAEQAGEQD
ncbi:hypothetical protein [Amycolatopsis thermoflava]|uniref:hypothetical protein n=1 Tax=Amycolatopsis thermoflava TaxID=84480 RepID=UPI00364826BD